MARPLIGYVRVSQVRGRGGESFISPKVQEDRIRQWAAAHGHELADVLVELDESGARRDRPLLMQAVERVEAGAAGGIVVAKLDRFGRSLVDALALIERLQAHGATFVSVADGFDLTTETGRLVLRIMLALAEFELDRIRGSFADGRRSAVARGLHLSARAPTGYVQVKDADGRLAGPLEVDPVAGPAVREAFAMRAQGRSWRDIAEHLQAAGVTTAWGNEQWVAKSCRAMIQNRVYLGEARHGEYVTPGAHPALVDEVTWRRANQTGHRPVKAVSAAPSILQGLMRCGSCRHAMGTTGIRRPDGSTYRRWACTGVSAAGRCPGPASISTAVPIEGYVVEQLKQRAGAAAARLEQEAPDIAALDDAREELRQAVAALEVYRDDPRVIDALGADAFAEGLAKRAQRMKDAEREVDRLTADRSEPGHLGNLLEVWDHLEQEEQRELLRTAVQGVYVRPGRSRHTPLGPDNVRVVWRGEDVAVPSGVRSTVLPPLRFGDPAAAATGEDVG
ncbi:recombinase family protein [Patulibacter sp. SYSU D01012]|uniref:recombinase family protein n=1 Tax=Patulibacter sp. SYSU D01012 TaxID=2817381 RepID=UPI001B304509|nr:recombinase family protein [Patulibacter sp. SYSU D01012]